MDGGCIVEDSRMRPSSAFVRNQSRMAFRFANQNACYLAFLQSILLASDILHS